MTTKKLKSSWVTFILFYLVLISIVSTLDWINGILTLSYWGVQVGLITLGVGILTAVGIWTPDLSAARGVLLAFTVGILTIIPAVLMGMGKRIPNLWPQYFYIALGMAAGSFMSFLFIRFTRQLPQQEEEQLEGETEHFD